MRRVNRVLCISFHCSLLLLSLFAGECKVSTFRVVLLANVMNIKYSCMKSVQIQPWNHFEFVYDQLKCHINFRFCHLSSLNAENEGQYPVLLIQFSHQCLFELCLWVRTMDVCANIFCLRQPGLCA